MRTALFLLTLSAACGVMVMATGSWWMLVPQLMAGVFGVTIMLIEICGQIHGQTK